MRITATLVATALCLAATASHGGADVQGSATVIDSNTLEVEGTRMRLWGLEAPTDEWCSTPKGGCGKRARRELEELVEGERLWCTQMKRGRELVWEGKMPAAACAMIKTGRSVEHPILTASDQSVNVRYVAAGWAAAYSWYYYAGAIGTAMSDKMEKARKRKRGMWRYELTIPEESIYRRENPAWAETSTLTIRGKARRVVRGDRLEIDGREIQLAGISAANDEWCPEDQCAFKSTRALAGLLPRDRMVTCAPVSWDTRNANGVTMAMCTVVDPVSDGFCDRKECWMNWKQVADGHAIARREQILESAMVALMARAEDDAIRERRGMWKSGVDTLQIADESMQALPWQEAGEKVSIRGPARVLGPDLLKIGDETLKLYGAVGARSEWCKSRTNRDCDREARTTLEALVDARNVECTHTSTARYFDGSQRVLCTTDDDPEGCAEVQCTLSWKMLRQGWATWIVYASGLNKSRFAHELIEAERAARKEKKGMWRGRVKIPRSLEDYRNAL